jgi:hypothetical protein
VSDFFDQAFNQFPLAVGGGQTLAGSTPTTDEFPVFSPSGQMLGNLTSSQGQVPSENSLTSPSFGLNAPTVPAIGGGSSAGAASIGQAATSAGISTPAAPTGTTGSTSASPANNWFVRAVIVILGFIFVAVGLSQFGVVQRGLGER